MCDIQLNNMKMKADKLINIFIFYFAKNRKLYTHCVLYGEK